MSNYIAGSLGGNFPNTDSKKLEILSLIINNSCNLSCKHCYLQAPKSDDFMSNNEWMKFLTTVFASLKPSILSFVGKEIFFDSQSVSTLLGAVRLRNVLQKSEKQKTQIGVITNCTLIHNYKKELKEISPDYWDVSIDGLPATHDFLRGAGTFKQLAPNLQWLTENFPGRVWITHTVHKENLEQLPEFLEYYHTKYNLHNFAIGFYKAMPYTDQSLSLGMDEFYRFTDTVLPGLSKLNFQAPVLVKMECDYTQYELLDAITAAGWADPVKSVASTSFALDNFLKLRFDTIRIPVGLWHSVRVTPEGYWLAAEDSMQVKNYGEVAVAKVREYNYDAERLYKAGLSISKDNELPAKIYTL